MREEPIFDGDYSFNTGKVKYFTVVDYFLFIFVLLASAGIGLVFAYTERKKKNAKDYLLAGKSMGPIPVGLSMLASFMSAITLLGTPTEIFTYTTVYSWIGLGYFLVIAAAAHIYIPIFYNLRVTSAYEYLERRFSKGVRTLASCAFVFQMIIYMAIVLYAPSLAINAVTGLSLWGTVLSVGIVCTLYTTIGGMKAVIWSDSMQVIMMFLGLAVVLIKGILVVGGLGPAWESAERAHRMEYYRLDIDPRVRHTVWSLTFGGYFTWVAIFGVNQAQVQRAVSARSLRDAQIAMWLNFPGLCGILYLCVLIGIVMSAFYEKCDPLKLGLIHAPDQILPLFVMDTLGDMQGLPGLFVAGLFSGALSTISSGLNSIAAVVVEDVIKGYIYKKLHPHRAKKYSQAIAVVFGVVCLLMTYVASKLGNILQAALALFGMIAGPLLGVFSLGMFFPWANKWGAYGGLSCGLGLVTWINVGSQIVKPPQKQSLKFYTNCNWTVFGNETRQRLLEPVTPAHIDEVPLNDLYRISYIWYSAVAFFTVLTVGLVVSVVTGPTDPKSLDPRLICPVLEHVFPFCYLPDSILRTFRFGIVHEGKYNRPTATTVYTDIYGRRSTRLLNINSQGEFMELQDMEVEVDTAKQGVRASRVTFDKQPDD